MHPDGQRHHLLLGLADWARCTGHDGVPLGETWAQEIDARAPDAPGWDDDRHELTLAQRAEELGPTPGETPPSLDARRAVAADASGNIYWIDGARLRVRSHGDGRISAFWPDPRADRPPPDLFADATLPSASDRRYVALAVTADAWLVAAFESATGNGHDAFDLVAGGPPMTTLWPSGIATAFDLTPRPDGGLWLLDRTTKRLIGLNAALAIEGIATTPEPDLFQPLSGDPRAHAVTTSTPGRDLTTTIATADPIAIEALAGGRIALLTRTPDRLWLLKDDAATVTDLDFPPLDLIVGDVLLRGGERATRLLAAGDNGNQLRAFRLDDTGAHATPELFPLRRYGGRALVRVGDRASYDSGLAPTWVPVVERPRRRYATSAVFTTPVLDGVIPQTVWDRLSLDACIPPGTRVTVEARAADDRDGDIVPAAWTQQPAPILAGEAPHGWYTAAAVAPTDLRAGRGTWQALFQHVTGRYAQLRITLEAEGDATPRLRALRAAFPRVSWAERYLPAVYREDPGPADFLDRFLANLEGTTAGIEARIADAQALFDPRTAPKEALDWLADWFDVALDPAWEEARRRRFIAHAATFFAWRGTVRGVESALALAFGADLDGTLFGEDACCADCTQTGVRIVETWLTRRLPAIVAGDPGDMGTGLQIVSPAQRWTPVEGNAGLAARLGLDPVAPVPLTGDAGWRAKITAALGFTPAATASDRPRWQRFLSDRYRRIAALRSAHAASWATFGEIPLPTVLPQTTAAQTDWLQFEGILLAMAARAHRFSVLLPLKPGDATDATTLAAARRFATRIVDLEKPAHTIFDVRFYFAMNRLGEARLGIDTRLGQSSRAPELLPPAILGQAYAGESFIGADGAPDTAGRRRLAC